MVKYHFLAKYIINIRKNNHYLLILQIKFNKL